MYINAETQVTSWHFIYIVALLNINSHATLLSHPSVMIITHVSRSLYSTIAPCRTILNTGSKNGKYGELDSLKYLKYKNKIELTEEASVLHMPWYRPCSTVSIYKVQLRSPASHSSIQQYKIYKHQHVQLTVTVLSLLTFIKVSSRPF